VVNGFKAFGFQEEATQLKAFLKGIGEYVNDGRMENIFTPKQILYYQKIIQKKNYMQDQEFIKIFFKSISNDGKTVTVDDMRRMLKELKQDENRAEEYVERTAGMSKAKYFTLEQMSEVIRGKMVPQSYTQKKQRDLEIQKQKELIKQQEELHRQQMVDEPVRQRDKNQSDQRKKRRDKSKKVVFDEEPRGEEDEEEAKETP